MAALTRERFAALKSRRQKLLDVRNGLAQPRDGGGAQRLALLLDHRLKMSGIFDASVAVVGAAVARQFRGAIKQAHGISIGHQRERPAHGTGRDGIVVQIKAHIDGLVGLDGAHDITVEGVLWQR